MAGRFVEEIPPHASLKADKWTELARTAQDRPNTPLLAGRGVHERVIKRLRARVTPPFVQSNGRIRVSMRGSSITEDGRVGDVYLTWVPNENGAK